MRQEEPVEVLGRKQEVCPVEDEGYDFFSSRTDFRERGKKRPRREYPRPGDLRLKQTKSYPQKDTLLKGNQTKGRLSEAWKSPGKGTHEEVVLPWREVGELSCHLF